MALLMYDSDVLMLRGPITSSYFHYLSEKSEDQQGVKEKQGKNILFHHDYDESFSHQLCNMGWKEPAWVWGSRGGGCSKPISNHYCRVGRLRGFERVVDPRRSEARGEERRGEEGRSKRVRRTCTAEDRDAANQHSIQMGYGVLIDEL